MEKIIGNDFSIQGLCSLDFLYKNNSRELINDSYPYDPNNFDFLMWNQNIFNFNTAFSKGDSGKMIESLTNVSKQLEERDDLIASFLDPLESSDFYDNCKKCFSSNNAEIVEILVKCFSLMAYISSDCVLSICKSGILNFIIDNITKQLNSPFPSNAVKYFFKLSGYICQDGPNGLVFMVQLGIIPLCKNALLNHPNDFNIIDGVLECLNCAFEGFETLQEITYPFVPSLFFAIKVFILSLLNERSDSSEKKSFENRSEAIDKIFVENDNIQNKKIIENVYNGNIGICFDKDFPIDLRFGCINRCLLVFLNYCCKNATASILLNSTVPQFCYDLISLGFLDFFKDTYQKNIIIHNSLLVIKQAFKFGPQELLRNFINECIDVKFLASLIDTNCQKLSIDALSIIKYIFYLSETSIPTLVSFGFFYSVLKIYNDSGFGLKSAIVHIFSSAIMNATTSVIEDVFRKECIVYMLIDGLDTNNMENEDEIYNSLNKLKKCSNSEDDEIFSLIASYIDDCNFHFLE